MKALAETIQRLRKSAGLTQDELGKKVGVSMQAVSRWENGGLPDAELLPAIASALGTSIDALFGRDTVDATDTLAVVSADIARTLPAERFYRAWRIAAEAVAEAGFRQSERDGQNDSLRDIVRQILFSDNSGGEDGETPRHARFQTDSGLSMICARHGNRTVNIIPRPRDGYESLLLDAQEYRRFFSFLAREHRLDMMIYLAMHGDTLSFTAEVAAEALGIGAEETKEVLADFSDLRFLRKQPVETSDGVIVTYQSNNNIELVPFLYAARDLMNNDASGSVTIVSASEPLLKGKPGASAQAE